jgi:hypothetical protein
MYLPLTRAEHRLRLERAIEHQTLLLRDAAACGLPKLSRLRRDRLRGLKSLLKKLDATSKDGAS